MKNLIAAIVAATFAMGAFAQTPAATPEAPAAHSAPAAKHKHKKAHKHHKKVKHHKAAVSK